jgi:ATP-dependent exoDNAse (exonuclease V) beta subunit
MIDPKDKSKYYFFEEINEYVPRVTEVLKIIAKGEAFNNWLRNKGKSSENLLTTAGDIGSSLHKHLENIGLGKAIDAKDVSPLEEKWLAEFYVWQAENIDSFIETEGRVFHLVDKYAGTLDSLVKLKDGRIALLDYKTTKYIYDTHELQVVAYVKAYEDMSGIKINTAFILNFSKEDKKKLLSVKEVKNIPAQYEIWIHALKLWKWRFEKQKEWADK